MHQNNSNKDFVIFFKIQEQAGVEHLAHSDLSTKHYTYINISNISEFKTDGEAMVLPWAAYPSEERRRPREDNAASEMLSDRTCPSGWSWRELESTHCRLLWC